MFSNLPYSLKLAGWELQMKKPIYLGINIDHVATLRQARGTRYPDPVFAAMLAEQNGADGITLHLREDRRHIQERDVLLLKETIQTRMNLEMAVTDEMLTFAEKILPEHVCLVPEKREELTTEGGLDVAGNFDRIKAACERLAAKGMEVSLFIDPDQKQIDAAKACNAPVIELHTGTYAEAHLHDVVQKELAIVAHAAEYADNLGLIVNAGHGLHYHNTEAIARIPQLHELNIGHAIVAEAVFIGFSEAVRRMKQLMVAARGV